MIVETNLALLHQSLDAFGLTALLEANKKALIKINMADLPTENHPRTDLALLRKVIEFIVKQNAECVLAEGSSGNLSDILNQAGFTPDIIKYDIGVIDLDTVDAYKVEIDNQVHFIPQIFNDYKVRIALPCTSKRENMLFSNNIKLFTGAVPRRFYQDNPFDAFRSKIHKDLDKSVACIYNAIMSSTPFCCFINGGNSYQEQKGSFNLDKVYISDNGLELDNYMINKIFHIDPPKYICLIDHEVLS